MSSRGLLVAPLYLEHRDTMHRVAASVLRGAGLDSEAGVSWFSMRYPFCAWFSACREASLQPKARRPALKAALVPALFLRRGRLSAAVRACDSALATSRVCA
jgi:hypothetical protein